VARGKHYTLRAMVKNTSTVEIFQAIARLKNETDPSQALYLVRGRDVLAHLKPGEERACEFTFKLPELPKGEKQAEKYTLRLDVFEASSGKGLSKKFDLSCDGGAPFAPVALEPPRVAAKVAAFTTDRAAVPVECELSDAKGLSSFMILTVTRDKRFIDNLPNKVFFRSLKGEKGPAKFSYEVPLQVGTNVVSVVATDGDKLRTVQTYVVKRR
jgi:hypothetical protein